MDAERDAPAFKRVGTYDLYSCIGQGSFATVYRGQHRTTKRVVAVKAIVRARLNQKLQENLEAEISIMQSLEHPNVVRLFEVQTTERHVYLMLEFCPGGDLMRVIRARGTLDEPQAKGYLQQLALGLAHMRTRNLIHRDLKPQNLLLSSMAPTANLKIADFGFARYMQQQDLAETLCGSPLYMAPEILRFQKYDAKADLWSVGAILFEMLAGKPPFSGANHVQLLKNIDSKEPPALPQGVSVELQSMYGGLLQREPFQRLAFEEFFAHPFLSNPSLASTSAAAAAGKPPREERISASSDASMASPAFAPASPPVAPMTGASGGLPGFSLGGNDSRPTLAQGSRHESPQTVPGSPAPGVAMPPPQTQRESPLSLPGATSAAPPNAPSSQPATQPASQQGSIPSSQDGSPRDAPFAPQQSRQAMFPSPTCAPFTAASPPQSGLLFSPPTSGDMPALSLVPQAQSPAMPTLRLSAPMQSTSQTPMITAAPAEGTLLATSNALSRHVSPPGSTTLATCVPSGSMAGPSSSMAARQILPVPVFSASQMSSASGKSPVTDAGPACPIGYGAHASAAYVTRPSLPASALPVHDASLDGIDQEYVLISTRQLAATLPSASTLAQAAGVRCGGSYGTPGSVSPVSLEEVSQRQAAIDQSQLELAAQLARAAALADLAQESADGGPMTYGESFTPVEALALHVKALATMQQCLATLQEQEPTSPLPQTPSQTPLLAALQQLPGAASGGVDARLQAIRVRFGELLQSAERIRNSLRTPRPEPATRADPSPVIFAPLLIGSPWIRIAGSASANSSNPQMVCVEEMLYRHALGMGREAAVDELLGKLASCCVLYARAKLLLEQLALEPQVGDADRAVLCKYAAGFAWRLQEISQKQIQQPQLDYSGPGSA